MKVKQNYIQPKVDIILVELENCFSNIFPEPLKKRMQKNCNNNRSREAKRLPS